ncbi:MASE3 domain-containing protein [Methylococcus sp. EFPC2]|uniref:MASE3 domain-containing protein n=1 Tax=Methylococcus sp. EFPC2 TaxID=2812648 RepID=UPI001966CFA6|nr:MASE3 domain-containing protein [Methylococcus sp. EFPC2]QSA97539.1 PAS domain S-box protein [Methylococcus sp. EFPC2]
MNRNRLLTWLKPAYRLEDVDIVVSASNISPPYPRIWVGGLSLLLIFGYGLPSERLFTTPADYLPLHTALEFVSMAISAMVFGLAWNLRQQDRNSHSILLGTGFLAVSLIDMAHTLSYAGMPDFVTASGPEKAINFWLAARYTSAFILLAVALSRPRYWSAAASYCALASALALAFGVVWVGLFHGAWLPRTFIPGQGLTPFKIGAEYGVTGMYLGASVLLFLKHRASRGSELEWLAAAAWVQGLAEMFFTLYADVTDVFNLLGHVYKAVAYFMIYRALFVSGVSRPYRQLADERTRLHTLVGTIPDLVWLKDPAGVYLFCNPVFERLFGAREADIVGKTDYDFVDRQLADSFRRHDMAAMRRGKPSQNEEWLTFTADGYRGLFSTIKTPMLTEDGELVGVLGIARDVTQQHEYRKALEDSELRYRRLFESNPAPILIYERGSLNLLAANEAFFRSYGYDRDEFLSMRLPDLYPEDEKRSIAELASHLSGLNYVGEWRHLKKDGTVIPVEARSHDLIFDGRTARIAVVNDITERKQAEAAILRLNAELEQRVEERTASLAALNKELESFTYSVSHDLKAPLRGIDGYSRLLLEDHLDQLDEEGRLFLGYVRRGAAQMSELIDDLLAYSRMERRAMGDAAVDLNRLVGGLLAERQEEIAARGVRMDVDLGELSAHADPDGLAMVLRNLLDNALKFTRDSQSPTVAIRGRIANGKLTLSVQDNGIGFDMQFHDRIFEMFQRLQRAEDYAGTGIGLAIVRKAVQRMGGQVWADSAPGRGAAFFLELPQ